RVLPDPPGEARPHQLLVEAPSIREDHLSQKTGVPIVPTRSNRDGLTEGQRRREQLGPLAVRLSLLGRVDPDQPDRRRVIVAQHRDGVAVGHADDSSFELLHPGRAQETDQPAHEERRPPERASRNRPPSGPHGLSVSSGIRSVTIWSLTGGARSLLESGMLGTNPMRRPTSGHASRPARSGRAFGILRGRRRLIATGGSVLLAALLMAAP